MKETINNLFEQHAFQPKEGEELYVKDGLYHCKLCDGRRETIAVNPITGKESRVRCICKCQVEALEKEEKRRKDSERALRMKKIRFESFEDTDYAKATFDADDGKDPETAKKMRNYAKHFQTFKENGQGLILFGDVGTGKTFASACIANALIDEGYHVYMTNFPNLISKIQRDAFTTDYAKILSSYDLLIIDDLGVERSSEYMQENVYNIIDARYRANKPIIVSTNLTADELRNPKDVMAARIYGRILEKCLPVRFTGSDRRKGNARYSEMAALLNG